MTLILIFIINVCPTNCSTFSSPLVFCARSIILAWSKLLFLKSTFLMNYTERACSKSKLT